MAAPEEVSTEDPGVVTEDPGVGTTILFTGTEPEVTTAAPTSPPPGEYKHHNHQIVSMMYTSSPLVSINNTSSIW